MRCWRRIAGCSHRRSKKNVLENSWTHMRPQKLWLLGTEAHKNSTGGNHVDRPQASAMLHNEKGTTKKKSTGKQNQNCTRKQWKQNKPKQNKNNVPPRTPSEKKNDHVHVSLVRYLPPSCLSGTTTRREQRWFWFMSHNTSVITGTLLDCWTKNCFKKSKCLKTKRKSKFPFASHCGKWGKQVEDKRTIMQPSMPCITRHKSETNRGQQEEKWKTNGKSWRMQTLKTKSHTGKPAQEEKMIRHLHFIHILNVLLCRAGTANAEWLTHFVIDWTDCFVVR